MSKKRLILLGVTFALAQLGYAANVTNNIKGVGPGYKKINPVFCIQQQEKVTYSLEPGKSVDANRYSGNPYYAGGVLRFGGCGENNTYLGYLGLNVNEQRSNSIATYVPFEGVHIAYLNPRIDGNGNLTGEIQYTSIEVNNDLYSGGPIKNPHWDFVGFNLSGLEFGKTIDPVAIPNLSKVDAAKYPKLSDLAEVQSFIKAGMNTIRVPISWGFLQFKTQESGDLQLGDLNLEYYNAYVKPLLQTITQSKVYAMVDLHAYMRYSTFGEHYSGCGEGSACPDGKLVTDASKYKDVWVKLYQQMKKDGIDMNYVMLDLMNEPVGVPDDLVFTIQAEIIKALRAAGFQGYILVEGNSWTGLHSWSDTWKSKDGKTTYSNEMLFSRENFARAGITDLSKIIINVHQYLDSNYSGTGDQCVTDLNTKGANGFNLNSFVDYLQKNKLKAMVTEFGGGKDQASCSLAMDKFLTYMKDNSAKNKDYGFVGWTIWSVGHGWGDYNLRVKPNSYHMTVMKKYL